jgi:hypothetical protein
VRSLILDPELNVPGVHRIGKQQGERESDRGRKKASERHRYPPGKGQEP